VSVTQSAGPARVPPAGDSPVSAETSHLDAVIRGSRVVTAVVAASLEHSGDAVTVLQLRVLVLASTRPGMSATDLAEALGVHVSSASRTVERLVAAGLLHRGESTEDRRRLDLAPTRAGERLLDEVMSDRRTALAALLDRMSPEDRDHLARGMTALADAAGEPPGEATEGPAPLIP
jgi:DNA-binding MarR family transcriptional regulator